MFLGLFLVIQAPFRFVMLGFMDLELAAIIASADGCTWSTWQDTMTRHHDILFHTTCAVNNASRLELLGARKGFYIKVNIQALLASHSTNNRFHPWSVRPKSSRSGDQLSGCLFIRQPLFFSFSAISPPPVSRNDAQQQTNNDRPEHLLYSPSPLISL